MGGGGGANFQLLPATPTTLFSLDRKRQSRWRNQNAVFSRSKSYASDSMYDYFNSDSVANEEGACRKKRYRSNS